MPETLKTDLHFSFQRRFLIPVEKKKNNSSFTCQAIVFFLFLYQERAAGGVYSMSQPNWTSSLQVDQEPGSRVVESKK